MNLKRRTIALVNHRWQWLKRRNTLPVLICLLLAIALSTPRIHANEQSEGIGRNGTTLTAANGAAPFLNINFLASLPEVPHDSDDSNDDKSEKGFDETEDAPDDLWKTSCSAFLAINACKEAALFSAVAHAAQHRNTLPLFILYCSWKSFLS